MPFPNDEQIMKTAGDLIAQLKTLFGSHPGFRPAHAKGKILVGTFTPSAEASKLSRALHFNAPSTKVWLRFSNSTGLPQIPDNVGDADPRGLAIRFHLPEVNGRRMHTDIIAHSVPLFPVRTGAEFQELLRAIGASGPSTPDQPSPIEKFLGSHPAAMAFVTYPKPLPASYATLQYYGVSAFKLVDANGRETFIRYNIVPDAGIQTLDAGTVMGENYLQEELSARLEKGPIIFKIVAQVADSSDITDDATVQWPESREKVELGTVKVDNIIPDNPIEQKKVIFDPIPRVDGVEPSDDPLLEMRAAVYLMSGKDRRAA